MLKFKHNRFNKWTNIRLQRDPDFKTKIQNVNSSPCPLNKLVTLRPVLKQYQNET